MLVVEVLEVLDALEAVGVRHWVAGGWGVDALVGRQTREHRDLDLTLDNDDFDICMATLQSLGYGPETDGLPLRIELAAVGDRWVDLHPVKFDTVGHGIQGLLEGTHFRYPPEAFAQGRLARRTVGCLSVSQQQAFHRGYDLRPQDEHDLQQLQLLDERPLWAGVSGRIPSRASGAPSVRPTAACCRRPARILRKPRSISTRTNETSSVSASYIGPAVTSSRERGRCPPSRVES